MYVLVLTGDEINEHIGAATCALIYPVAELRPTLLDIPVSELGTVVLTAFHTFSAARFDKPLGPVEARVMEAVEVGLRAAFDL